MKDIAKISKLFLASSLTLILVFVACIFAWHYSNEPDLFAPPSDAEERSLESAVANSSDLNSLKSACAVFAKCRDDFSAYQESHSAYIYKLLAVISASFLALLGLLSYGYYRIYSIAKSEN